MIINVSLPHEAGWFRYSGKEYKRYVVLAWPANPKLGQGHYDGASDYDYMWNGSRWTRLGKAFGRRGY